MNQVLVQTLAHYRFMRRKHSRPDQYRRRSKKLKEFKALGLSAAEADAIICDGLYEDGAALDSDDEVGDAISSDQVEAVLEGPRLVGSGAGRAADPGASAVQPPPLPGSRVPTSGGSA